jgi:drug/metabolite transporter (DMT)-like permease
MRVIAVLLAAGAAAGWGASDYFGGDVTRGARSVFAVVAVAELIGVVLLVPILVAHGSPPPLKPRLLLAVVAGVAVTVELGLIYRALSRGEAFITAPVGALGTVFAVAAGLAAGGPLGLPVAIGLACAVLGGAISAWNPHAERRQGARQAWRTVWTCIVAAAAVATMLISLHAAARLDPYWATAVVHLSTGLSAAAAAVIGTRRPLRSLVPRRELWPKLALIATAGTGGDVGYVLASHGGSLSIVAAISSLYPVSTIALGALFQGRRATAVQLAGIVLGLGGAVVLGAATG